MIHPAVQIRPALRTHRPQRVEPVTPRPQRTRASAVCRSSAYLSQATSHWREAVPTARETGRIWHGCFRSLSEIGISGCSGVLYLAHRHPGAWWRRACCGEVRPMPTAMSMPQRWLPGHLFASGPRWEAGSPEWRGRADG